jgi:hypothetical protein
MALEHGVSNEKWGDFPYTRQELDAKWGKIPHTSSKNFFELKHLISKK